MSFSWNPFARNKQPEPEEESFKYRNPNFGIFNQVNSEIERAVANRSVVNDAIIHQQAPLANPFQQMVLDENTLAIPVASNKQQRIQQYRTIAALTECQWCLDEIADEFIHEDENGRFINIKLPERLNEVQKDIIQSEFDKYINLFRLRDEGYNMIKRFLVEGELAWENIIKHDHPEMGIIGVRFLPCEYYDTLLDVKTNRPVGIVFDSEKYAKDIKEILSYNYASAAQTFNAISPVTASFTINKNTCTPMLWSQLTYIDSGEYSYDNLITFPLIEKTKQAYYQLALMMDAAVILRVTRAPERLLFNVSTGKMTQNYADEYVRRFANSLKAKKVATPGNGGISQVYNPVSKLESYIFGKSDGNDGTSVESVGSSASYDEIADIEFFLRRFMKQFKVPFTRYKTPENAPPPHDQLSAEELSFLRMIIRYQRRFADGFKKGFITHLKLRGIWDNKSYAFNDSDIQITLVKPSLYEIYQTQQIMELKMNTYKSVVDNEEFSKITAMKKFLGLSDAEVDENFRNLIKEKELTGLGDFYADQIKEKKGLVGWDSPLQFKADEEADVKLDALDSEEKKEGSKEGGESEEGGEGGESEEPSDEGGGESPEPATPKFGLA